VISGGTKVRRYRFRLMGEVAVAERRSRVDFG
jgi:hypothetical protein